MNKHENKPGGSGAEYARNEQGEPQEVNNEQPSHQGRANHMTGSTTQGGSNFGQGSSHLGGESYTQGDTANVGSNYEDEAGKIGDSTVGTNEEGAASPTAAGKDGGAGGYDAGEERRQIDKEQDEMHNERDQENLNVDRSVPQQSPEVQPNQSPEVTPNNPNRANDNNGQNASFGNERNTGGWSQSSWSENNSPR